MKAAIFFWTCVVAVVAIAIFYPLVMQVAVVGGAVFLAAGQIWLRRGTRAVDRWTKP